MDVTISGIKETILSGFEYAVEKGGVLARHTVTLLKQGAEYARADVRAAVAITALANPIFLEIALGITGLVGFRSCDKTWKNIFNLTFVASLVAGMNVALAKGLQSSLTPGQIALVSVASCTSYFFLRLWIESRKG